MRLIRGRATEVTVAACSGGCLAGGGAGRVAEGLVPHAPRNRDPAGTAAIRSTTHGVMHGIISTDAYAIPPQPNVHYMVSCHETNEVDKGIQAKRVYRSRLGQLGVLRYLRTYQIGSRGHRRTAVSAIRDRHLQSVLSSCPLL